MPKQKKQIVPFSRLRWQVNDTLEALSHEILLTMQCFMLIRQHGAGKVPAAIMASLAEREAAMRKLCFEPDEDDAG